MPVHIFCVNEVNYQICIQRGLVGLPEPKEGPKYDLVFDGLLSRMALIHDGDYILMYVAGKQELRGLWQAEGLPFYDTVPVWSDKIYPFRCKIRYSKFCFQTPLKLNDINDMRSQSKIWTWSLQRPTGANAMFAISNAEFEVLFQEYMKINPFTLNQGIIREPYPFHDGNLIQQIHYDGNEPKYEYSTMSLLNYGLANGYYHEIFGNYSDSLCYIPTNLGKEMDILLYFNNPLDKKQVLSYDIIEVKRDKFDEKALTQLIDYESWFLQKKVAGDQNMVRTTAIARSYTETVVDYVRKRTLFENKPVKLLTYEYTGERLLLRLL